MPALIALQGVTPERLQEALPALDLSEARKVVSHVHRDLPLPRSASWIRRGLLEVVRAHAGVPALEVVTRVASQDDPFVKLALRLSDGRVIETVRIPLEKAGRFSVCVSSQVGCALGCAFCATGRMGLGRNLEAWEIVEQVRAVRRTLDAAAGQRVHGVVFQGMGEPLANVARVIEAIRVLVDPCAQAIDARNVTVCTAGVPEGIARLAEAVPRVRLGLSIGSAREEVRCRLMPVARAHSLRDVLAASIAHARTTGIAPMWAVTMLSGVNDTPDDAAALAALARELEAGSGKRPRISLVPYNRLGVADDPFTPSTVEAEALFRETLREGGFGAHKRYSGGGDVAAACGQLSARAMPRG